jgi:hypothetical protein
LFVHHGTKSFYCRVFKNAAQADPDIEVSAQARRQPCRKQRMAGSLICSAAPQFAVEGLLRADGFKEIAYVEVPGFLVAEEGTASKLALDRLRSNEELCSQSTILRLENLPDRPPSRRFSACSLIACRVWSPESRGVMPPRHPFLQPSAPTLS